MKFICYPKCSTCAKARTFLGNLGETFEERNIKEENPSYDELKNWFEKSGLPLKRFFNTSGILYRQLNLKDKLKDMNEEEQLQLLSSDGMLVKRPLLINEDYVLVGFKQKEWEDKLLK